MPLRRGFPPLRALALWVMCFFLTPVILEAQEDPLNLTWDELGSVINGERVAMELTDGPRIEGTVRIVREAGIEIEIRKTDDEGAYPKGLASIDRTLVSSVQLVEESIRWRWIGAGVGFLGATLISTFAITGPSGTDSDTRNVVAGFVTIGGGLVGYFMGREKDRRSTSISVVTDPARARWLPTLRWAATRRTEVQFFRWEF